VDLILANGANYAKWMKKVSLPLSKIINTSKEFSDNYIEIQEGASHSHGATGEHVHYDYAFTTWLDFKIATGQAEAIMNVFVEKLPEHKAVILSNYDQLKSELSDLDASMVLVGDKLKSQTLFASHPVYQYAEQAYDLKIISEHWEPGQLPSDEQWQDFLKKLDQHPSAIMLWEGEPSVEITSLLMESGVESIVFDPCGSTPAEGDFMSVMSDNINRLKSSIK
jgi:zinc transport system substrate-binding protein